MKPTFEVTAKIAKPINEVYDAVYNPEKLSRYFVTAGASGPLDAGATVNWGFHDFDKRFDIHVNENIPQQKIVFEWANKKNDTIKVEFTFERINNSAAEVRIKEFGWNTVNQEILDESYKHCQGWTQMLCCLKVFVEHGFNLREFYF